MKLKSEIFNRREMVAYEDNKKNYAANDSSCFVIQWQLKYKSGYI